MKKIIATLAVFLSLSLPGFALVARFVVTPDAAEKEYGIKIKTQQYNPHQAGVTLEFKPEGYLKEFSRVEMAITQGENWLVFAGLATKLENGVVTARFDVDPSLLPQSEFTVYSSHGPRGNVAYQIRVKDFLPADGTNDTENKPAAPGAPAAGSPPATGAKDSGNRPAAPAAPATEQPKGGR